MRRRVPTATASSQRDRNERQFLFSEEGTVSRTKKPPFFLRSHGNGLVAGLQPDIHAVVSLLLDGEAVAVQVSTGCVGVCVCLGGLHPLVDIPIVAR